MATDRLTNGAPSPARYRNICVTLNNPTRDGPAQLLHWQAVLPCKYIACQLEEKSTKHFQAYIELSKQMRQAALVAVMEGAHFDARKGTAKQASDYCILPEYKGEDKGRIDGPWIFGELSAQGERSDIDEARDTMMTEGMKAAVDQHFSTMVKYHKGMQWARHVLMEKPLARRDVEVHLLYGPGGVGKNHYVWTLEDFKVHEVTADLVNRTPYDYQPALLIDEFTAFTNESHRTTFNKITDVWPYRLRGLYGDTQAQWDRVYVGTNVHPKRWYNWEPLLYHTLCRRITHIHVWDVNNNERRPADRILEKGTQEWDEFFM